VNQRVNAPQEPATSSNLADMGWVAARTFTELVEGTPVSVNVADREATVNFCGVTVAMLQGHSWALNPTSGLKVNVGTGLMAPLGETPNGSARCQRMLSGWGGGAVVVRAQESCVHGEGLQRVRSSNAQRGGRW